MADQVVHQPEPGDDAYVQWALGVLADKARAEGAAGDESWLRLAMQNVSTLVAIRAAHTEFQSTHDLHELARAVGQILNGPDGDMLAEDQRVVVRHPDDDQEEDE